MSVLQELLARIEAEREDADKEVMEMIQALRAARRIDGGNASEDARIRLLNPLLKTTNVEARLTSLRQGYPARLAAVATATDLFLKATLKAETDAFLIAIFAARKQEIDEGRSYRLGRGILDRNYEPIMDLADRLARDHGVHNEHLKLLTEEDDRAIAEIVRGRVADCADSAGQ